MAAWEKLDMLPSNLMLVMTISDACLFLLPYIVKEQRKKRMASSLGGKNRSQEK